MIIQNQTLCLVFAMSLLITACKDDNSGSSTTEDILEDVVEDTIIIDSDPEIAPDPCDGLILCDEVGSSCENLDLLLCEENADGCLVQERITCEFDCSERIVAACEPENGCVEQTCSREGTRCSDDRLFICRPDENGCFQNSSVLCEFGCNRREIEHSCYESDPCENVESTRCTRTTERFCQGRQLDLIQCVRNEDMCLVEEIIDCPDGQVCGVIQGEYLCVDPCEEIETCSGPTMCDGDELVLCEADMYGCFIETNRIDCTERDKTCDPDGGVCSGDELCGEQIIQIDCNPSGSIVVLYGQLQPETTLHGYCNDRYDFEAVPTVFEIINSHANYPKGVRASLSWDFEESGVYLKLIVLNGESGMCIRSAECLSDSRAGITNQTEYFQVRQGSNYLLVDSFSTLNEPVDYMINIDCDLIECNDGFLHRSEQCEDGNIENEDGCSSECLNETNWACETRFNRIPNTYGCRRVICNDGIVDGEEECEDGNAENGDGCNECYIEEGYDCATFYGLSTCIPLHEGDSCQNAISLSEGEYSFHTTNSENDYNDYYCESNDTHFSAPGPDIVFSITIPGHTALSLRFFSRQENLLFFSTRCEIQEELYACRYNENVPIDINISHFNNTDEEEILFFIADENEDDIENYGKNFLVTVNFNPIIPVICGDGRKARSERCDDGNIEDGDGCSSECEFEDGWTCYNNHFPVDMEAEPPVAATICRIAICGDGFIDQGERCDDGNTEDGDGCSSCVYDDENYLNFICTTTEDPFVSPATECRRPICGNIIFELDEQCEDGNNISGDGCSEFCMLEPNFFCEIVGEPCAEITQQGDGCFDPIPLEVGVGTTVYERTGFHNVYFVEDGPDIVFSINVPEHIILHMTPHIINDHYSISPSLILFGHCTDSSSLLEFGDRFLIWENNTGSAQEVLLLVSGIFSEEDETSSFTMEVEFKTPECGDEIVTVEFESCDDGNIENGDGCSSNCSVESGWECYDQRPSYCVPE